MGLDCSQAEKQCLSDLPVAHPPHGQLHDATFGGSERVDPCQAASPWSGAGRAELGERQLLESRRLTADTLVQAALEHIHRRANGASARRRREVGIEQHRGPKTLSAILLGTTVGNQNEPGAGDGLEYL